MSKAEEFIQENTIDNDGSSDIINWYYKRLLTPDAARKAVEIAREEIYEWLGKNIYMYNGECVGDRTAIIEDLKQAMKDE